ncbi:MAG: hypothetical protein ACI35P_02940 [Bacillus sp. (in: firmicutes)]
MFDPTAYENFKVIIEGSVYDHDLTGDILVVNRSEIIDTAILARQFSINFIVRGIDDIEGSIILNAKLEQLAGEILDEDESKAGAFIILGFTFSTEQLITSEKAQKLMNALLHIWGKERQVTISTTQHFETNKQSYFTNEMKIFFNRRVTEDLADDLYTLPDYMIKSLTRLSTLI